MKAILLVSFLTLVSCTSRIDTDADPVEVTGKLLVPVEWMECEGRPGRLRFYYTDSDYFAFKVRSETKTTTHMQYSLVPRDAIPPGDYFVRLDGSPQFDWEVGVNEDSSSVHLEAPLPSQVRVVVEESPGKVTPAKGALGYWRPDLQGAGTVTIIEPESSGGFEFCAAPGKLRLNLNTAQTGEIITTVTINEGLNEIRFP